MRILLALVALGLTGACASTAKLEARVAALELAVGQLDRDLDDVDMAKRAVVDPRKNCKGVCWN